MQALTQGRRLVTRTGGLFDDGGRGGGSGRSITGLDPRAIGRLVQPADLELQSDGHRRRCRQKDLLKDEHPGTQGQGAQGRQRGHGPGPVTVTGKHKASQPGKHGQIAKERTLELGRGARRKPGLQTIFCPAAVRKRLVKDMAKAVPHPRAQLYLN